MLSDKMQEALNAQINAELYSSYLYLSMAAYFYAENFPGFANWMRVQEQEERTHATRFYDYIISRNGRVTLRPIEGPQVEWESPLAAFEDAYKHEQKVTGLIHKLVDLALNEGDHATHSFLKWFVDEQVEEEANVDAVVQDLRRAGNSPQILFMLDRELGARTPEAGGEVEAG
jgi:ferritin